MERCAWKAKIKAGKLDEYKKCHDDIWPEMKQMFREAGINNYSIWNCGEELFGYYECENTETAERVQRESDTFHRWKEYLKDIMLTEDEQGKTKKTLTNVFLFEK